MADKTCICGDPTHTEAEHTKRSFIPAIALFLLGVVGVRHARKTGRCLCGDVVHKVTGWRPPGEK